MLKSYVRTAVRNLKNNWIYSVSTSLARVAMNNWPDDFTYRVDLGAGLFTAAGVGRINNGSQLPVDKSGCRKSNRSFMIRMK